MASNLKNSPDFAEACLDGGLALFNSGGYIEFWSGTIPANCAAADATGDGDLLATCTFSTTAFAAAGATTARRAISAAITSDSDADASADATHFRMKDSGDACHLQGTAGEAGDTPDLVLDDKSIVEGGIVAVQYLHVDMGET